jgi:competence ComEA-like helix-hairpin-helix protein
MEATEAEIPDWLQEVVEGPEDVEAVDETEQVVAEEKDELSDWIQEVVEAEDVIDSTPPEEAEVIDTSVEDADLTSAEEGVDELIVDAKTQLDDSGEIIESETPEESVPPYDLDDPDAAMAWLESLAAKQGVSEDELLTSPEERSDKPPEWVQEAIEDEPVVTEPVLMDEEEPVIVDEEAPDAIEDVKSEPLDEIDIPDWLQEAESAIESAEEAEEAELPDWLTPAVAGVAGAGTVNEALGDEEAIEDQEEMEPELVSEKDVDLEAEGIDQIVGEVVEDQEDVEVVAETIGEPSTQGEAPDLKKDSLDEEEPEMFWLEEQPDTTTEEEAKIVEEVKPEFVEEIEVSEKLQEEELSMETFAEGAEEAEEAKLPDGFTPAGTGVADAAVVGEIMSDDAGEDVPAAEAQETIEDLEAEIPDWQEEVVKDLEEDKATAEEQLTEVEAEESLTEALVDDESEKVEEIETPDWLQEVEPSTEAEEKELPDWLAPAAAGVAGAAVVGEILSDDAEEEEPTADVPESLEATEAEIPEWLQEVVEDQEDVEAVDEVVAAVPEEQEPDFVDEEKLAIEAEGEVAFVEEDEEKPAEEIETSGKILEEEASIEAVAGEIEEDVETELPDLVMPAGTDVQEPEFTWLEDLETSDEQEERLDTTAEMPALEEGEEPEIDDADAAMAWLESLAAKQGVSEDELLTSPEDRSEIPPEWVQDADQPGMAVDDATVQDIDDDFASWLTAVPEAKVDTEVTPEIADVTEEPKSDEPELETDITDVDSAMAWLESLAAKQGVSEDELLTSPEERTESPPEWIQDTVETQEPLTSTAEVDDLDDIEKSIEDSSSDLLQSPDQVEDIAIEPPSWISDGQVPEDEDMSWIPAEDIDDESQLLDLNQASLIQLERLPGIGFRRAQSITAYRDEQGEFESLDELLNVPGMDHDTLELLKTRVKIKTSDQESITDVTPELDLFKPQDVEPDDEIHEVQLAAQEKLNDGDVESAVADYQEMISKGERLSDVIQDLIKATEKFPEEVSLMQTLGDAYVKANKLQEALDAYTRAQNLIQ